jgi:hypothetical protein
MHAATGNLFPHRSNQDGTYDSICTMCLLTIATVSAEAELARHEREHACNPIRLYQLREYPPLSVFPNGGRRRMRVQQSQ